MLNVCNTTLHRFSCGGGISSNPLARRDAGCPNRSLDATQSPNVKAETTNHGPTCPLFLSLPSNYFNFKPANLPRLDHFLWSPWFVIRCKFCDVLVCPWINSSQTVAAGSSIHLVMCPSVLFECRKLFLMSLYGCVHLKSSQTGWIILSLEPPIWDSDISLVRKFHPDSNQCTWLSSSVASWE